MKKLERLQYIERVFGSQHLQEYCACSDFDEICAAANIFESRGQRWNLRTDTPSIGFRSVQADLAPFIFLCDKDKARAVFDQYGKSLIYIVFRAMERCYLNGVAIRIDDETVFFEYNEIDQLLPQRRMYDNLGNLSRLIVGQFRRRELIPKSWPGPVYLKTDEAVTSRKFDDVYDLLLSSEETELTFALRYPDKQVIIW